MNPQTPSPVVHPRLSQKSLHRHPETASSSETAELADADPPPSALSTHGIGTPTQSEPATDQLLFLRQCLTQLPTEQLQAMLEFGQQELSNRQRHILTASPIQRETSLLLKKDYSYQERGLSEPTQYYVYLRRRKPKLDRYIGTLFYVPQGCALSYIANAAGQILFQAPHNIFQLTDAKDDSITQVVRLIGLEPPPADYTFIKQQNDMPAIHLRLAYLDPLTLRPIAEHALPFPSCMHEGGALDRYRWDVSLPTAAGLQLPEAKSSTFYLRDRGQIAQVLERLQVWVSWSEKAMPQAQWTITQQDSTYALITANFKRSILSIAVDQAAVTLHGSLPVMVKWFHDLSLAVSQFHNQGHDQFAQLKLAHNLFVEMSLPPTDLLLLLKKLFGVDFTETS